MTESITNGAHHVGLTVPDIQETGAFFRDALGYEQVGEMPDYPALFLSDGATMITLWQAENPEAAVPFDRRNVIGLHHLALRVSADEILDALNSKLESRQGVAIEFAPEPLSGGPTRHMMCSIPGGIRVELIAPAG